MCHRKPAKAWPLRRISLMEVITHRGRLYELTIFGDIVNDELVLECWDLSKDGGFLFVMVRDMEGQMILRPQNKPIPLDLLERVAAIAGIELGEPPLGSSGADNDPAW